MTKRDGQTWHPEDIKAALRKRGTNLAELSRSLGLHPDSCRVALRRSWPRCERAIARALGVSPAELWPDRYCNGRPIRTRKAGAKRTRRAA